LEVNDFIKKMLTKQGVQYIVHQRRFYILGDPAFELANVFNRQTRRPMAKGLISPHEIDALPMIQLLIRQLLGEPTQPNEICYFSVPAEPIDSTMNVTYHREIFAGLLKRMGYKPQDIAEGHAVVFSELAEDNFTGIGISWGAGMANVSVSYMTVPALTFATSRGGDWIDENAAMVLGMNPTRAQSIKEKGVDLMAPQGREQEAISIYYRNLISYTLKNIADRFTKGKEMPSFPGPIDIVCAGGTARAKNFVDVFSDEFEKLKKNEGFPLEIKNIRLAEDPMTAIAKGCMLAANNEMDQE
jgi:hypothetical protein